MPWYDNAVFYHIYPLGLTGAPRRNEYEAPVHRLNDLIPWVRHIRDIGCNALYIGPLFESGSHGYDTTDYSKLDSRLGTNEDLKRFTEECHDQGIRVILDGVFNHTGRDFFAFRDLQKNRENSRYRDWFCNVNFGGNNEYNDGFSYDNWGGHNLLVKLNQQNGEVRDYLLGIIRMWVAEFNIDGLRLDAADVLDFGFMQALRRLADELPGFWLMGEVIHGDYTRWVNDSMLHSVTDYNLHKALYSGHNDHNYFEIAHTVKRIYDMGLNHPGGSKLYSFADNHDVERICTKLLEKAHYIPLHILLYTLPGIPSVYYGSEFGIEGRKEQHSDDSLRPALNLEDYKDALTDNPYTALIASLGKLHQDLPVLSDGDYRELVLTNRQYAFSRTKDGCTVIVAVNNDPEPAEMRIPAQDGLCYTGALSGKKAETADHCISCIIPGNSGEIWVPDDSGEIRVSGEHSKIYTPEKGDSGPEPMDTIHVDEKNEAPSVKNEAPSPDNEEQTAEQERSMQIGDIPAGVSGSRSYEDMTVEELQAVILEKLAKNGPVTDQMRRDVAENVWHDSLVNWVRSFN